MVGLLLFGERGNLVWFFKKKPVPIKSLEELSKERAILLEQKRQEFIKKMAKKAEKVILYLNKKPHKKYQISNESLAEYMKNRGYSVERISVVDDVWSHYEWLISVPDKIEPRASWGEIKV